MKTVENRWFGFVLFIALLFFCILMGLVPLLAGTTARADSITFEQFYQASLDTSAGNTSFNFVVETSVAMMRSTTRPIADHDNSSRRLTSELTLNSQKRWPTYREITVRFIILRTDA